MDVNAELHAVAVLPQELPVVIEWEAKEDSRSGRLRERKSFALQHNTDCATRK